MAKQNFSITFRNSTVSLEDNEIIEHTKEEEIVHVLSDVIKLLEDKTVDITFKEIKDIGFEKE